ncbi:MAG TPA: bifunctional (p)ppGpp synthetase/guanosine-3',5'-bis(diphosphate) 3'-pyrophosphohydrolase [Dehalococcoidia bacterium]|nr:bifunctional (p)ppGpp synthetase/guanosine-3',5'-bis(diphosphate) 3'-pyrophosphohydrolase [Dehalococcoidia bacterium]
MDASSLMEKTKEYLPPEKLALVEAAYQFALNAHQGQVRKSGAPYLDHPLQTAIALADLQLDAATLAAALLHDVPEDCGVPLAEIEAKFGSEVSKLVDGTTKLSKLSWRTGAVNKRESQAENLRKMLIAMAEDLRVVFIKLADRLHNMYTLGALSPGKRHDIAQETLEVYAPLAHRLGIWKLKWQLEDLAFRYLEPRQYHKIARLVATRRTQREGFITEITKLLRQELDKASIKAEISGRPKHIYSIYNKMNKYSAQGRDFGDIHDLFALRVLVDSVSDCYKALGIIHNLWHPLPEEFSDFIANPKDTGYQSLHTTVLCQGTTPLEIQIRTYDMHRIADYGLAAHWRYKEAAKQDTPFEEKIVWLRQLIEWQSELGTEEFLESLKTDVFIDQVFVYTPKGEIKALPKGATPLDFAYRIHTELGHRCIGAKVNGRLVPLNHKLNNGDIMEIMTTKADRGPSLDWLNPELGYVKTSHAREKIRQWFKRQERAQNIERGKQIVDRELKRLGISLANSEEVAHLFNYESFDDFVAAIGYGGITPHQLALKLAAEPEPPPAIAKILPAEKVTTSGIQVLGVGDLLTHLASCCHPLPGDDIIGYITRSHGVNVHRRDCINITNEKEKERLIEVSWGQIHEVYPVGVQIDAWDRVGLLRDITTVVAEEKVNIASISTTEQDNVISVFATFEIRSMAQLTQLLSKIQGVRGVISATRSSQAKASLSP